MGLSRIIPMGIVIIPIMTMAMTVPGITNTLFGVNGAALDVSSIEDSILNTHFRISDLLAVGDGNQIYFNVTNTGTTKFWDYDNFDLILTYEAVKGANIENVTERLGYTEVVPTGDPITLDAATGYHNGACILIFGCSFPHTVTSSGSNRILVVGINTGNNAAISGVDYNGVSMTHITLADRDNGANAHTSLWYLTNPSTGTHNVHISLAILTTVTAGAISFTGVDQTDPIDVYGGAIGSSPAPQVLLTTTSDESWIVDVVGTNNEAVNVGAGQIERWNEIQGANTGAGSTEFTSAAGTFSMSWSKSGNANWAISAAALKPSGVPCCVSIGEWNIKSISNDVFDPGIINNNETAAIRAKTSYQIVDNGRMVATLTTDNGVKVTSFVVPS